MELFTLEPMGLLILHQHLFNVTETYIKIIRDINCSIIVERDNIIIDGNNNSLLGEAPNFIGIDISYRKNVIITRLRIENFSYGVWLEKSDNNRLFNNTLIGNEFGLWLSESDYNDITANIFINCGLRASAFEEGAIFLYKSNYNTIVDNKIADNYVGIVISYGTGNILKRNSLENNKYAFNVGGVYLYHYINDIDQTNSINNKPWYYWINRHDETVPLDAGGVVIVNSTNIRVENLVMTNNFAGIDLVFTENSQINNVIATNNVIGISLYSSHNNIITNVNASNNAWCGIILDRSHSNLVMNITAAKNAGDWAVGASGGIYLKILRKTS